MSKNESLYIKKVNKRKLSGSLEFTTSRLSWQVTLAFTLYFAYMATKGSAIWAAAAGIYGLGFLIQYYITKRIIKEVTNGVGEISSDTLLLVCTSYWVLETCRVCRVTSD